MLKPLLLAAAIGTVGLVLPTAGLAVGAPQPEPPCCADEFDWLTPYTNALSNHGLGYLNDRSIAGALAARDVCGLVPAIGAVATVEKIARDYAFDNGTAGKVVVAAADVCPKISPMLG